MDINKILLVSSTLHGKTDLNEIFATHWSNLRINESCIPKNGEILSKTNYLTNNSSENDFYFRKTNNSSAKDVSNEGKNIYKGDLNKSIQLTLAPKMGIIYSTTNYSKLHTPTSPNPALNSAKNIDYQEQSINKSLNQSPNKYEKTGKSWVLEGESPKTSAKDNSSKNDFLKQATEVKSQSRKHTEIYGIFAGRNARVPDSISDEMLEFGNKYNPLIRK